MYCIKKFETDLQSQVTDFYAKCLPQSGRCFDPDGIHKCLTEIEKTYDFFLCLFDETEVIGTIAVNKMDDRKCELRSVFLLKEYQGQGLGTKMMKEAIQYAKDNGFDKMYLDTISSTSQKAIRMYERCGFTHIERYKDTIYSDVFMKLALNGI